MNILVTGGAGFIGSFLVDALIKKGHRVRIYDNLEPQVHHGKRPSYLNKKAQFIKGDLLEREKLNRALKGIDIVFHEASMVGVGQSMYEIQKYTEVNSLGTAILLDLIVNKHRDHIKKILFAGSMSSYGEGLYKCKKCGSVKPHLREEKNIKKGNWEPLCPKCNAHLTPLKTSEEVPLECNSIYAINKKNQEEMIMTIGKAYKIPTVTLRYFNTYGPRQSLSNPYTGVAAIFISRIKAGKAPVIFEDGAQRRNFVSVHDIVSANIAAMESKKADYQTFNVGSGDTISVKDLALLIAKVFGSSLKPEILYQFRKGDIRHCYADISKIKRVLKWKPKVKFEDGIKELVKWSYPEEAKDIFDQAKNTLKKKGIVV